MKPAMLPAGRVERLLPDRMLPRVTEEAGAIMPITGLWRIHRPGKPPQTVGEEAPTSWEGVQVHLEPFFPMPMETILQLPRLDALKEYRL